MAPERTPVRVRAATTVHSAPSAIHHRPNPQMAVAPGGSAVTRDGSARPARTEACPRRRHEPGPGNVGQGDVLGGEDLVQELPADQQGERCPTDQQHRDDRQDRCMGRNPGPTRRMATARVSRAPAAVAVHAALDRVTQVVASLSGVPDPACGLRMARRPGRQGCRSWADSFECPEQRDDYTPGGISEDCIARSATATSASRAGPRTPSTRAIRMVASIRRMPSPTWSTATTSTL